MKDNSDNVSGFYKSTLSFGQVFSSNYKEKTQECVFVKIRIICNMKNWIICICLWIWDVWIMWKYISVLHFQETSTLWHFTI